MPRPECAFDAEAHRYAIGGRPVPSVTQVLADLLPGWQAGEWYLQRGQSVHACMAMIGREERFTFDERIAGQVAAGYRWFQDMAPDVIAVEKQVYSERYQFAGTLDFVGTVQGKRCILDWKASLTDSVPLQCAGYAIAYEESTGMSVPYGCGVQLQRDGRYQMSKEMYPLKQYRAEFLALLTSYNVRRRLKIPVVEMTGGDGE